VDAGDTVMDYLDMERERGITINAAAITMPWRKHTINLIDTPVPSSSPCLSLVLG